MTESGSLEQTPEETDTLYFPALADCTLDITKGLAEDVVAFGNVHVTGDAVAVDNVKVCPWHIGLAEAVMADLAGLGFTVKLPAETEELEQPFKLATTE